MDNLSTDKNKRRNLFLALSLILLAMVCLLGWWLYVSTANVEIINGEPYLKPKLIRTSLVSADMTNIAKFILVPDTITFESGCIFLDDNKLKDNYNEIIRNGTVDGSMQQYYDSSIQIKATGDLESRVYDYGKCGTCPKGADCKLGPCGEKTFTCINAKSLERVNDDGIKYGANWFNGYISEQKNNTKVVIKYDDGSEAVTYENKLYLDSAYYKDFQPGKYLLIMKDDNTEIKDKAYYGSPKAVKVLGDLTRADVCSDVNGVNACINQQVIKVEKILNEFGSNLIGPIKFIDD